MANQPRGRLLPQLIRLRAIAKGIIAPAHRTYGGFKYISRLRHDLLAFIDAINADHPGTINRKQLERYLRNATLLKLEIDAAIVAIKGSQTFSSTSFSSQSIHQTTSKSSGSLSSQSFSSKSSRSLSWQSSSSSKSSQSSQSRSSRSLSFYSSSSSRSSNSSSSQGN